MTSLILCLGEILFDLLADQNDREITQVTSWTSYPGGAPANVACALVKLGTPSAFMGCVGEDKQGDTLIDLLKTTGVDITGIQRHQTAPTRQVYVTRSKNGERHFASFGETPTTEFADTRLVADNLPNFLFRDAKILVLGTLGLAYPDTRQAMYRAIKLAKENQVKVLIDLNWRPVFWENLEDAPPLILEMLRCADTIKCSDDEAKWLFNTDRPQEIQQQLKTVKGVLVTKGEKGCQYCLGENLGQVDSFKVATVDTTGAGDSFLAGFIHQYLKQDEKIFLSEQIAKEIVIYASAVGALTTTKPGAIASQPNPQEVQTFLANYQH
ncbi:carbohydrate kinase [Aphanothece hegewaldii CCALA 016]|uniref:Carbohydrate kinase n=1 Tax=Aphanothece hegewaldii CCALA 016 TaxID=2107694 RepID=A0A2T1LXN5_9CHRO|nr:carbohydrate kinase [Aphanothece hegewaldii]PSF37118.1 carbohydrate kinase [Aphanothece hegewaldii CCALA 016]